MREREGRGGNKGEREKRGGEEQIRGGKIKRGHNGRTQAESIFGVIIWLELPNPSYV